MLDAKDGGAPTRQDDDRNERIRLEREILECARRKRVGGLRNASGDQGPCSLSTTTGKKMLTCAVPELMGSAASPDDASTLAALLCLVDVLKPRSEARLHRELVGRAAARLRRMMRDDADMVCT